MEESDHSDFQKHIQATQEAGEQYLSATILPYLKQFSFTVLLYVIFWHQLWWLKWTLLLTIPFCAYNLYKIFQQKKYLQDRIEEMEWMVENNGIELSEELVDETI